MKALHNAFISTGLMVIRAMARLGSIALEHVLARDRKGLRELLSCALRELSSLVWTHLRTNDYYGLFGLICTRFRDLTRTGPYLARTENAPAFFCVFGIPVQFEKPSQVTARFAEIASAIGPFGIYDDRIGALTCFREGFIEPSDSDPETFALTHGIPWEIADLVLDAQIHDWRFLVFLDETGPLVFAENRYIRDDPEDDVSLANWRVVEAEIFDKEQDRELIGTRGADIQRFGHWGEISLYSALEDVTPQTAVMTADGDIWIRAELITDYVSALADYPILCDDTHAALCAEIEADALERWVFAEIGIWLARDCETLEEAWHDLEVVEQAALWYYAREQSSSPCWVDRGALRVAFDQVIPYIMTQLSNLQAATC